jgi:23S rRNA (pseudouridine1915-N3)-methyltransferase
MRIWIAAIGSRPREGFDELARMYLDRIAPMLPGGKAGVEAPLFRTEPAFWEAVERERARTAPLMVLLDEHGKAMRSEAFAAWLGRERDDGRQLLIFAVGPADGWQEESRKRAGLQLSLGPMTMAHELARVVVCEQVYRALTILKGHPYHRS